MKTSINNLLKTALFVSVLFSSIITFNAAAATVAVNPGTVNPDIKKVMVKGNARVIIIQDTKDFIKVDESDMGKVSIKQTGHTLSISADQRNPITVFLHVKDLYRIEASDKANVSTSGKIKTKNLQVILKDYAVAQVKANTESLYTLITGQADLKLLGNTAEHIAQSGNETRMNTQRFAAVKTQKVDPTEKTIAYSNTIKLGNSAK